MTRLTNQIEEVYRDLGRILANPESFGLGKCAPKPLVDAIKGMRHRLSEELAQREEWLSNSNGLSDELSQDSDAFTPPRAEQHKEHRRGMSSK